MRRSEAALALSAALSVIAVAPAAHAYCRTSYCPDVGTAQVCTPAAPGDCGKVLYWPTQCVSWSLQKDASAEVTFAQAEQAVKAAFQTWMNAPCNGGGPGISVVEAEPVECTVHEYNQEAGNANAIMFRDDSWPYAGSGSTLALTTVTYDLEKGEIYDADMELNSATVAFSVSDVEVDFDLLSILTHEAGHFLGLAHTPDPSATMFPDYHQKSLDQRDLAADDVAGICAIYPPATIPDGCDATPRHGFSALCASDQAEGDSGCSVAAPVARGGAWASLVVAVAAIGLAARRARRRA